jgi:hypothetical protein
MACTGYYSNAARLQIFSKRAKKRPASLPIPGREAGTISNLRYSFFCALALADGTTSNSPQSSSSLALAASPD